MSHIILGIHGLANKPPKDTLDEYWRKSIGEGLFRNFAMKNPDFNFQGVYWADLMYPESIPDAKNDQPYTKADGDGPLPIYKDSWKDEAIAWTLGAPGKVIEEVKKYFGIEIGAELILKAKLNDLYIYYNQPEIRDELRGRLQQAILDHREKRIMLIAHSMGSIIAYDVLRMLGTQEPELTVGHLITIGSPLGLPHVIYKIHQEDAQVCTPAIVKKWTNFADRMDPVAVDVHLRDDFDANENQVRVRDDLVSNGYQGRKGANRHKSYGYLRTPELSECIREFIAG